MRYKETVSALLPVLKRYSGERGILPPKKLVANWRSVRKPAGNFLHAWRGFSRKKNPSIEFGSSLIEWECLYIAEMIRRATEIVRMQREEYRRLAPLFVMFNQ